MGECSDAALAAAVVSSARRHPFGETANPAEYVPREATEEALVALERGVRDRRVMALIAPPGLGKSLLLQLLAARLSPAFTCLLLPYSSLPLPELSAWALGLLGERVGDDPQSEFLHFVRRSTAEGRVIVLLIDDCGSMPVETARSLGVLVRESLPLRTEPGRTGNRLRVVGAATDDAASRKVFAALHPHVAEVRFGEPMSLLETQVYVQTRLAQADVPEEDCARLDDEAIDWIYGLSGGVPRLVHHLAGSLLDDVPRDVSRAWSEDGWLGGPITDVAADPTPDSVGHRESELPERDFEQPLPELDDRLPDLTEGDFLDQRSLELPEVRLDDDGDVLDLGEVSPVDSEDSLELLPASGGDDEENLLDLGYGDHLDREADLEPVEHRSDPPDIVAQRARSTPAVARPLQTSPVEMDPDLEREQMAAPADDDTVPHFATPDPALADLADAADTAEQPGQAPAPAAADTVPNLNGADADADANGTATGPALKVDDEDLDLLLKGIF